VLLNEPLVEPKPHVVPSSRLFPPVVIVPEQFPPVVLPASRVLVRVAAVPAPSL